MVKEEYDLRKAWDEACDAFQQSASDDLKTKPKYTVDEVLEQIRAKQEKDAEKSAKFRVAKDVLTKTLDCIDSLGNIAIQGASMAFGPATFAGNALSFLIATGVKYRYIFEGLSELFGKISDFLVRFKIYFRMPPAEVDVSLRKVVNELLICFVSICGMSIKYLKKNKFLLYLQVFAFSDDSGVSAKLEELAALVERESALGGALTLEAVKNVQSGVASLSIELAAVHTEYKEGSRALTSTLDELTEADKKREVNTTLAKQLKVIEEALGNPSNNHRTVLENFMSKKVEGTGDWIRNDPRYIEWLARKPGTTSILSLSGGEGYGKSFLVSNIISDLRTRLPTGGEESTSRSSIAYYFFQKEAKTSEVSKKDPLSLVTAIKSLAWQIANSDAVFRKEVHSVYAQIEGTDKSQLWSKLFASSYKSDATFYLILDGVDNIEATHVALFSEALQQALRGSQDSKERGPLCFRILISGRNRFIEDLAQSSTFSNIDVATSNFDDIEKFVLDGIGRIKILGGATEEDKARREGILSALTENAKGDFFSVNLLLKQISEKRRPAEMLEVLANFQGENRFDTIGRTIEELNKTLDRHDIADLNELLAWVLSAFRPLTLNELETILLMTNGQNGSSLQPLADSINERYSKLFTILIDPATKKISDFSQVKIASTSIEEYFRQTKEEQETNMRTTKIGNVHESEVRIVRHFLRTVCDPALFQKFQFDQYFLKMSMTTTVINFDTEASHLEILSDCLNALCSEDTKWEPLINYVTTFFAVHLSKIDLSLTDPKVKANLGGKLVQLFTDEKVIGRWWRWYNVSAMRYTWLINEAYNEEILNWFKDSAVIKGLETDEITWARALTSNSAPEADLLENVAKFIANKWLNESHWPLRHLVLFMHGYICKIELRLDPSNKSNWKVVDDLKEISEKDIEVMLAWAKTKLGIAELEYEMRRNLARTYRDCGYLDKAIELFKETTLMQEDNWLARWGLATSYRAQGKWELATEILGEVIRTTKSDISKEFNPKTTHLPEMQREFAESTWNSGNFEKGIELYETIMKEDPNDYDTPYEYFTNLVEKKNFTQVLHFIQSMKDTHDDQNGCDRWSQFLCIYSGFETFHEIIANAAAEGHNLETIQQGYVTAIEVAREKEKAVGLSLQQQRTAMNMTISLLQFYAIFVYYSRLTEDSTQVAIKAWEELLAIELTTSNRQSYLPWVLDHVRKHLPFAYVRLAKESGFKPAVVEESVAKLQAIIATPEEEFYNYPNTPNTALARLCSLTGNKPEIKKALKSQIKIALELLSDDDPENDWQGYQSLSDNLMFAGEIDNFLSAGELITPFEVNGELPDEDNKPVEIPNGDQKPVEIPDVEDDAENEVPEKLTTIEIVQYTDGDIKVSAVENNPTATAETQTDLTPENSADEEEKQSEADTEDSTSTSEDGIPEYKQPFAGPISLTCDGICDTEYTYTDEFYCCVDCADVLFNAPCLERLRAGTLGKLICGPDHEMLYVPKYNPKKLKQVGKGNVEVGGKVMSVKEWLDGIRKDWGLEVPAEVKVEANPDEKASVGEQVVEVTVET